MREAPLLFIAIGVVLIWAGLTGRLAVILAAIFSPGRVQLDNA